MRLRPVFVLVPLVLLFLLVGLVEASRDSVTVDEAFDVAAGVTTVVDRDLAMAPDHDVLVHVLPALPALFAHPVVPNDSGYQRGDWYDHTDAFIRANEAAGRWHRVLFLYRLVPLAEGAAVGVLLYVLGSRLFGESAGLVAAGLWLTTPIVVGYSHVASIDIVFALMTVVVSLALLHHLERPSDRSVLLVGLALGGALLARHLGLVLVVVAVGVIAVAGWRRDRRQALVWSGLAALVSWAMVWIVMRAIAFTPPVGARRATLDGLIATERHDSLVARVVLAVPWPKEWAAGFAFLIQASAQRPTYLLGHSWNGGRWWYWFAVIPTRLPAVALIVLVAGLFGWSKVRHTVRSRAFAVLVLPAGALVLALALQPLDLGLRYLFPSLALWFVVASPIVLLGSRRVRLAVVAALAVTQLAAFAVAYPHNITWTAPPFQPAYRWTNVDFGQDAGAVDDWARGKQALVDLLLPRGFDPPSGSTPLLDVAPADVHGWVAVSDVRLTAMDRDRLSWLRAYCPVDTIGDAVLVYRFDAPVDPRPGPTMPADRCSGDVSTRAG